MTTYIALAESNVLGNIDLETFSGSFTGTSSGSGTGSTKRAAEDAALNASNKVLFALILVKLGKLLDETTLASKDIKNFIDNNVKAKVKIYKLLKLNAIASSKDGVNFILNKNTQINDDEYVTVENGQTLNTGKYTFTNNGYFQIGDSTSSAQTKGTTIAMVVYSSDFNNTGTVLVNTRGTSTINPGITFSNSINTTNGSYGTLYNEGIFTNNGFLRNNDGSSITSTINIGTFINNGTITNSGRAYVKNSGTLNNGGTITNSGNNSYFENYGIFTNNLTIENSGQYSGVTNSGTFTNSSTIINIGSNSYVVNNSSGTFTNDVNITNSGSNSYVRNIGTFTNNGTFTNGVIITKEWNGYCTGPGCK